MKATLWITAALLLGTSVFLILYLLRSKNYLAVLANLGVADLTAVISLALNAALFLLTILSLVIAVAAFKASEKSGDEQLKTLNSSREALQLTADTLKNSAQDFRDSALAAKGQYTFLLSEKAERDKAVASGLLREFSSNADSISGNEKAIAVELQSLQQNSSLVAPLNKLETSAWELLKLYIPQKIGTNSKALEGLVSIYGQVLYVNEVIRSREEYRLNNGAMSNYASKMTKYDQTLQELDSQLLGKLKEISSMIKALPDPEIYSAAKNH